MFNDDNSFVRMVEPSPGATSGAVGRDDLTYAPGARTGGQAAGGTHHGRVAAATSRTRSAGRGALAPIPADRNRWHGGTVLYVVVALAVAAATVGVMLLSQNIMERKVEARQTTFKLAAITEETVDPAEWGKNFPRQYDSYRRTVDIERTRHGGSEAFQKLDEDPRWRVIFAGHPFSIDYREERGHAYMLSDQRETERVHQRPQPGACLHCHSSVINAYRRVGIERGAAGTPADPLLSPTGQEQLFKGFEAVCAMPYGEATKLVEHPVSCLDCHDPVSMALRITHPAFQIGIQRLAESDDPVPHLPSVERWRTGGRSRPYDPNIDASRQECARWSARSATSSTTSGARANC